MGDDDVVAELLVRYVAALNARSLAALDELVADSVLHDGDRMTRRRWWDERVAPSIAAVPDLVWHVDERVVAGDRIAVRYTDTGTPVRSFFGRPPDGTPVRFREYVFYRVVDGRIAETWSLADEAGVGGRAAR